MFHVKQFKNYPIHEILFYLFLFLIPIQTRVLYSPQSVYIDWYFNYHLAFFFYLTDILLIGIFVSWLFFDFPHPSPLTPLSWLTLAFTGIVLLSLFHVKHLNLGLYQALKWLEMLFLFYYIFQTFRQRYQFKLAATVVFLSGVIQAIIGLVQFHVQHNLGLSLFGEYIAPLGTPGLATIATASGKLIRAYGTFPHPNVYAGFLLAGLFFGLFLFLYPRFTRDQARSLEKWIILVGLIIILLGIFVSFSRLAWAASLVVVLSFTALVKHQKRNIANLIVILFVSCATIFFFYPKAFKARVLDINQNQSSIADRGTFNKFGLEIIRKNPFLGTGAGNYVPALQSLHPDLQPWQYQPPHNIFIFIASELGILGLVVFLWMLALIIRRLKNILHEPLFFTCFLLLITFLLMGLFDHYFVTIQQGRLMFFTVLGLVAALPNLYDQRSN